LSPIGTPAHGSGMAFAERRRFHVRSGAALAVCLSLPLTLWASLAGAETVTWTGPAEGDWSEPANWSTGLLPDVGDAVIIGSVAEPVSVTYATGDTQVLALTLSGTLRLAAGTLTLTSGASAIQHLRLSSGAGLTASGAGTVLDVTESASIDGGSLIAADGAEITLPPQTAYDQAGVLRATGPGSRLSLAALSSIGVPTPEPLPANEAISRAVGVSNGIVDDTIATLYQSAVSRALAVYNDPLASRPTDPLALIDSAVSRAVAVYNDPLAAQPTDPLAVIGSAVSRAVAVYNNPLAGQPTDPLAVIDSAVSRAVGVYNDPLAGYHRDPLTVIDAAVSRAVGAQNGAPLTER